MKKLTRAEEDIMQIIWAINPCTVGDIRDPIQEVLEEKNHRIVLFPRWYEY